MNFICIRLNSDIEYPYLVEPTLADMMQEEDILEMQAWCKKTFDKDSHSVYKRLYFNTVGVKIYFKTEEDAALFLLRWA